eukprot:13933477-Alexandrium_andersonii.AAC.1
MLKFPDKDAKMLAGNAMHVGVMALWTMFVLGNTMRVEEFYKVQAAISERAESDLDPSDDDGEDEEASHVAPHASDGDSENSTAEPDSVS